MASATGTTPSGSTKTSRGRASSGCCPPSAPPTSTLKPAISLPGLVARRGREREVVRLRVRAVLAAAGDREVELARQVAEPLAADDRLLEALGERARVDELVGVEARERAADDVADVVHAALLRVEPGGGEALQDPRGVLDGDPAQLDVLAGRDVGRAASAAVRDLADGADLLGGEHAVGDAHPQHEVARRRLAVEQPVPLQPLEVVGRDGVDALDGVAVEVRQDVEAVFGALEYLDAIGSHGRSPPPQRWRSRVTAAGRLRERRVNVRFRARCDREEVPGPRRARHGALRHNGCGGARVGPVPGPNQEGSTHDHAQPRDRLPHPRRRLAVRRGRTRPRRDRHR